MPKFICLVTDVIECGYCAGDMDELTGARESDCTCVPNPRHLVVVERHQCEQSALADSLERPVVSMLTRELPDDADDHTFYVARCEMEELAKSWNEIVGSMGVPSGIAEFVLC